MALVEEALRRARDEIDRCAVGRDNPTHRALVAGELDEAQLRELGRQQWIFHAAFPQVLAALAAGAPAGPVRARILADAYDQETGMVSGVGGRLELWEAVCACWGLGRAELEAAEPAPATAAMLALQGWVARLPFVEAYLGLQLGVYGESAPHMAARREAMERHYGVEGAALAYFSVQAADDPLAELVQPVAGLLDPGGVDAGMRALALVLHARWGYFDAVGRAGRS